MSADHVDIDKHVKTYIGVFVALMVLTVITVAIFYLHLPVKAAIALALFVATIKGSLVACFFMHLISEKKLIYAVMGLTVAFFFVLLLIPFLSAVDQVGEGTRQGAPEAAAEQHDNDH